jgi:hypothetical protein
MNDLTRIILGRGATLALVLALTGCGEQGDRPSDVHTLRVLAVRSETPFGRPGTTAELSMLAHDGSPRARLTDGSLRSNSTLWIGGCNNPPGDSYAACVPYLHEVVRQFGDADLAAGSIPADAPSGTVGWGQEFAAAIPGDIISGRKVAEGVVYPYGVQVVFFAHCGGVLRRKSRDAASFPLGCFDAETGEELGRDDFEYGFYPLFVYDEIENANPTITAARFTDNPLGAACSDGVPCADGMHCGSAGLCIPVVARCKQADKDDCESYRFAVEVPRSSVERAVVAHVPEAEAKSEGLWISYYADAGSFEQDARIINDQNSGWSDDTDGKWRAYVASSREVRLWAVVRDNRNGVAWAIRDVWVE